MADGDRTAWVAHRWLVVPAAVSLTLTATSLSYNEFFRELAAATKTSAGSSPLDLFVVGACLIVLLVGLLDRSKVMYSYYLGALLYLPSVLGLSKVDWLAAAGFEGGVSVFASELSGTALVVIGVVTLACVALHRAAERQIRIRAELRSIGAPRDEVDRAVDRMFISTVVLVIAAGALTVAAWAVIEYLMDHITGAIAPSPTLIVLVGLVASVLLVLAVALFMRSGGRGSGDD